MDVTEEQEQSRKLEDFQAKAAGRFRDDVHVADVSDRMQRTVKESLLKFDGKPLFPERIARTFPYRASDAEGLLYNALVKSWPEIARLAREERKPEAEQTTLFASVES